MRFTAIFFGSFAGAMLTFAVNDAPGGAPVPRHIMKPAAPAKLTPEMLHGTWQYQWNASLEGSIEFNAKDMTYVAKHTPNATTIYSGTFSVGDSSITIVEYGFDIVTERQFGPQVYRFDVEPKGWPVLAGKTTGAFPFNVNIIPEATMHLKLSDRK